MASPQEPKFITSRTIKEMGEHYNDIWSDILSCGDRVYPDTELGEGTLGALMGQILGPAYNKAQMGCHDALQDGALASLGIRGALSACAGNWRRAEEASIVDYR